MRLNRTEKGRYQLADFDDDTGQVFLIVGTANDGGGAMQQSFPLVSEPEAAIYRVMWPAKRDSALKTNMVMGADGQMYFLVPADYVGDQSDSVNVLSFPDCDAVLNQHASVINQIKDALVEHGILGEATVTVAPDAASCVAKSNGPSTVVPMPISARARSVKNQEIMTCVARGVDPKVNGVLLVTPSPISTVARSTMHHQWISVYYSWAVCGSKQPTVVIS